MADTYEFLSDEWLDAARKIRDEYPPVTGQPVRMNMVITDSPFGEGDVKAHLDTAGGEMSLDTGHVDEPDVVITIGYDTAKAYVVNQDQAAVMQAFMAGTIKVQGDMTKLMGLAQATPDPNAAEVARRIQEITA